MFGRRELDYLMMHGPLARGPVFALCIPVYVQIIVKTGLASVDAFLGEKNKKTLSFINLVGLNHSSQKDLSHQAQLIGSLDVLTLRKSKITGLGVILNTTMCGKSNVSLIGLGNVSVTRKEKIT